MISCLRHQNCKIYLIRLHYLPLLNYCYFQTYLFNPFWLYLPKHQVRIQHSLTDTFYTRPFCQKTLVRLVWISRFQFKLHIMYFFNFQHPIIVRDFNFFFHLHKWTHKLAEESVKKSFWVKVRVISERLNWSSPCSPAAAKNVGDVKKLKKYITWAIFCSPIDRPYQWLLPWNKINYFSLLLNRAKMKCWY